MLQRLVIVAALMLLLVTDMVAEGKEIRVLLKSGETVEAELIAVRDDAVLIAREIGIDESQLMHDSSSTECVPLDRIAKVAIKGSDYVWLGALIGLPVGVAVANLTAGATDREYTGIAGGVGGLLLGMIVGAAVSQDGQDFQGTELQKLREFSRYARSEPEFLKNRFPGNAGEESEE